MCSWIMTSRWMMIPRAGYDVSAGDLPSFPSQGQPCCSGSFLKHRKPLLHGEYSGIRTHHSSCCHLKACPSLHSQIRVLRLIVGILEMCSRYGLCLHPKSVAQMNRSYWVWSHIQYQGLGAAWDCSIVALGQINLSQNKCLVKEQRVLSRSMVLDERQVLGARQRA